MSYLIYCKISMQMLKNIHNRLSWTTTQRINREHTKNTEYSGETKRAEHRKLDFKITLCTCECAQRALLYKFLK